MAAKDIVEAAITGHKIAIFAKSYCPYCKAAKATIDGLDVSDVAIYQLDERDDGADIQKYLLEKTGQRTVPNIFIAQTHIGGNDDLQSKVRNGTVKQLLAQ